MLPASVPGGVDAANRYLGRPRTGTASGLNFKLWSHVLSGAMYLAGELRKSQNTFPISESTLQVSSGQFALEHGNKP